MRFFTFILIPIFLTACSMFKPGPVPLAFQDKVIKVDQPITMPADHFSALFQYGKLVSQRELTIWDDYCRVRLERSQPDNWQWTEGQYRITSFSWYDDLCTKLDCDLVQRYQLETLSGEKAAEIDCRYRYAFGDPWAITGPHFLSPEQLDAVLGDYFNIVDQ